MAGEIGVAYVRIRPNSAGFQSELTRQTSGVGKSIGSMIGKGIALGIGATVAAAGVGLAVSTKLAVGFDRSMRNVNSIAQLTESSFQDLNKQVLALAASSGTAPQKVADGLYDIVSSGFKAADAMKILKASTKAARAGLTDAATSTKVVTAVLNAYHLKASQASKVSDQLFQTVNVGVVSFEELAQNIGDVLPFASSLGVGLDQVGASLATMTKEGINAAESTTRVKAVMTQFLSPSKDLAARFKDLGFESGEAMIRAKGFQGALDLLAKSTHGSKAEMAKLFPDVRALGGALALTGQNSKTANSDLAALRKSVGATDKAFKEQSKSISQQWQTMVARLQVAGIKIGVRVFPLLNFGLKQAARFVDFVDKELTKVTGPTLNGKPLKFKQQVAIVWTDVQPALQDAAQSLWEQIQAGADAAFQAVVGQQTVDVNVTPGIKMPAGGQTVIPVSPILKVEDTDASGPLHTWWANNVQPVIDDLSKQGGGEGGKSFVRSFGLFAASEAPKVMKGFADQFITGPLQTFDGLLRGDAGRIAQGFKTTFAGAINASGLGTVFRGVWQLLGKDITNALRTMGSLALQGAATIGSKIWSGIKTGLSALAALPGAIWRFVSSAITSTAGRGLAAAQSIGSKISHGIGVGLATVFSVVTNGLAGVGHAISSVAGQAAGWATSIGSAIISGIASGITSAVGSAISAVENAVGSVVSAARKKARIGSPSKLFADEVGEPISEGIALGITNKTPLVQKAISATLTSAAKSALIDAKSNMNSLAGGLGDMIGQIIDEQTRRAIAPLQAKLALSQRGAQDADAARQRADLQRQLTAGKTEGESDAAFLQRMADVRQQIADLDRQASEQALQDRIDAIQTEADKRKDAEQKAIADLSAEFNAGKITGKQFTEALTKILKANGASVASAGDLLGFAFAQAFSAQLKGITKQIGAIAAVIGAVGGSAGGAGFTVDVTNPLDVIKSQLKDAKSSLKQDQKDLRDARKTKDKKDDERARAAIKRDEKLIRTLEAILRWAAAQGSSGTINVSMTAGTPSIDELLAGIVGDAAR